MNYRNAITNQKGKSAAKEPLIMWNKKNMQTMLLAQKKFNELITQPSYTMTESIKKQIGTLQKDIDEYYTSTCNVCGDKQSNNTHMNIEHVRIKVNWGYESDYDGQTHQLILCCTCYTKYIMKSDLGKFVQKTNYM